MGLEWINARAAAAAVWGGKRPPPTPNAVTRRAKAGLVKAKTPLIVKSTPRGTIEERHCPIPVEFWDGRSMIPDWKSGDFSATVTVNGSEEGWKVFGVSFERSGIEEIAQTETPAAPSGSQAPDRQPRGGAPGKYDWARAVGTMVFEWSDRGTWHPQSAGEVRTKLADWFSQHGDTPDDKQLKQYARWLFDEFKKRNPKSE